MKKKIVIIVAIVIVFLLGKNYDYIKDRFISKADYKSKIVEYVPEEGESDEVPKKTTLPGNGKQLLKEHPDFEDSILEITHKFIEEFERVEIDLKPDIKVTGRVEPAITNPDGDFYHYVFDIEGMYVSKATHLIGKFKMVIGVQQKEIVKDTVNFICLSYYSDLSGYDFNNIRSDD